MSTIIRPNWSDRIEDIGGGFACLTNVKGMNADCNIYADPITIDGEDFTHGTRKDNGTFTKHRCRVNLHNSRTPLRIEGPDRSVVMLRPIQPNTVHAVIQGDTATYTQFWNGIDVVRRIIPEGVTEELTITSAAGQRIVQWAVTGDLTGILNQPRYTNGRDSINPPFTYVNRLLSLDLTAVPIWSVVS